MNQQEILQQNLRREPQGCDNWLVYADWLDEHNEPDQAERVRGIGRTLQEGEFPGAGMREYFNIQANDGNYANYLEAAGIITGSRHTQLQAEYLRNYLEGRSEENPALLTEIRRETRVLLGMSQQQLPDARITAENGRVNFNLSETEVSSTPPYFHASGNADFRRCPALTSVGPHFHAGGMAVFRSCHNLTSVGSHFHAGGMAVFGDCYNLTSVGEHFHAGGGADFSGCAALTSVGEHFHARDYADFRGCTTLTSVGEHFHARGNADFRGCTTLTSVGEHFHARGNADFRGCTTLTSVGEHFHARGNADFRGCPALNALPPDMEVGGKLHLPEHFPQQALQALEQAPGLSPDARCNVQTLLGTSQGHKKG